jgi:hypothetical protein
MNKSDKDEAVISEEIKKTEDRIVASFLAKDFTIANYNGEHILFIHGVRGENEADIIMTIDGAKGMAQAILETSNNEQSGELDTLAQP